MVGALGVEQASRPPPGDQAGERRADVGGEIAEAAAGAEHGDELLGGPGLTGGGGLGEPAQVIAVEGREQEAHGASVVLAETTGMPPQVRPLLFVLGAALAWTVLGAAVGLRGIELFTGAMGAAILAAAVVAISRIDER